MLTFEMGFYEQESKSVFYDGQHELCLYSIYFYITCTKVMNKIWNISPQYKTNFILNSCLYFNILFDLLKLNFKLKKMEFI